MWVRDVEVRISFARWEIALPGQMIRVNPFSLLHLLGLDLLGSSVPVIPVRTRGYGWRSTIHSDAPTTAEDRPMIPEHIQTSTEIRRSASSSLNGVLPSDGRRAVDRTTGSLRHRSVGASHIRLLDPSEAACSADRTELHHAFVYDVWDVIHHMESPRGSRSTGPSDQEPRRPVGRRFGSGAGSQGSTSESYRYRSADPQRREIHAIMGKNGSGKSTLSKVLVGHPSYEVTGGSVTYKGEDLFELEPEERSHAGLFLSFQSPIEVPGVSNTDFLRMACNARRKALGKPEMDPLEFYAYLTPKLEELNMDIGFLNRNVNEGFSGGEKKRNEILQLSVLEAEMSILDEIDSGLDVDALRDVAKAVNALKTPENSILMITHYQRLLDYIHPDHVHIMESGKIKLSGGPDIARQLESEGYASLQA
eukprot:scaffold2630_cov350-Pavlova_lutheri.AAC.12